MRRLRWSGRSASCLERFGSPSTVAPSLIERVAWASPLNELSRLFFLQAIGLPHV